MTPDLHELRRLLEAATKGRDALNRMMDAWLDYHDAHHLTEPVTGRAGSAFEDALAARDMLDAALNTPEGAGHG